MVNSLARSAARWNPFRSECVERLSFRLSEGGWADLFARLEAADFRGAIVGPKGSGKTTLLLELAERLRARGEEVDAVLADGPAPVTEVEFDSVLIRVRRGAGLLFLDGADRFPERRWRQLRAAIPPTRGFVITEHRPGRLPVVFECGTTSALLADLVREILAGDHRYDASAVRLASQPSDDYLGRLLAHYEGNIRSALWHLYDCWAAGEWREPKS